ncbi:MAG: DUF58 domain-containing protein [Chloroflexi bacterium]|nr:DUF58 domain-containing protein [Chloroflexota bacterium]
MVTTQPPRSEQDAASPGLTPELIARIKRLEIRTRRLAGTLLAGDYRSIYRGTGIEFAEAREYIPGDDVRRIDWNVTARMGAPWVKEFVEERELAVICAVDISGSQLVARPRTGRLGAAAELTALFGFVAALNHDRAGLLTFTDRVERFVPPRHGRRHVLRMIREVLLHDDPHRGTSITAATAYLQRVLPRRSVVFLISDWFDSGYAPSLRALARRHDVTALALVDPIDLELPDVGLLEVETAEGGARLMLDTSDARVRERYAAAAHERAARRSEQLAVAGVDEVIIHVGDEVVSPIVAYFRSRARRR